MNDQMQTRGVLHPAYVVISAAMPMVFVAFQVLFGSAPIATLWFGLGISVVVFLLFRLLSGFAPLGRRRLRFGQSAPLKLWQAPIFWLPLVVVAGVIVFLWYVG
ncbi:MAG: hypothetical protein ACRD22_15835 [Terriglobia bacterium]